ncbi:MAG: Hpt domain-containing protein, partial [Gammaproteobacteria bacterium]
MKQNVVLVPELAVMDSKYLSNVIMNLALHADKNPTLGFSKYRSLFIVISLFALFFVFSLFVSYYMHNNSIKSINYSSSVQDIYERFNKAYAADNVNQKSLEADLELLENGGEYTMPSGERFTLPPLSEYLFNDSNDIINETLGFSQQKDFRAVNSSLKQLVEKVFIKKDKKMKLMTSLVFVLGVMAIILYVIVIIQLILQLARSDEDETTSKEETAGIMATVSEGLFLINKDYEIGLEQSASLKEMFSMQRDLEGNFFEFIGQYVTKNDIDIAQDYIELLFGQRVKEKLISDLNPLTRVKIHIAKRDGSYENRFLNFKFKRVFYRDQLSHLLVSTTDITRQVLLEQELEETRDQQESQIDLLMSILHVDNKALSAFFESTHAALSEVNQTLKSKGHSDTELRKKIALIARNIHKVKGDAGNLNLHKFENSMHCLEEELQSLKKNTQVNGKDLLELTIQLKNAFVELESMKCLVEKVSKINLVPGATGSAEGNANTDDAVVMPINNSRHSLINLSHKIANRESKKVMYLEYGMDDTIPNALQEVVNDIAIQLVRNSIVHGVELPEERIHQGKSPVAQVVASFVKLKDNG